PALSASVVNFCSSQSLGVAVQNSGSSAGAVDVTINGTTTNLQVAPGTTERALVAAVEGHTYTMTATVVSGPVLLSTTVIRDCEGGTDGGGGDDSADGGDDSTDDSGGDDGTTTTAPTTTMPPDDGGDDTGADDDTATDSTDDGTTTTAPTTTAPTTTMPTDDGGDDGTTTTAPTTTMPTDDGGDGSTTVPANGDTTENGELPVTGPAVLYVQLLTGLLVLCVGMVLADMGRKRLWL
ncbi:MAG: hypothetical protein OES57_00325, partial [Acidimicrobiia bacterium]|nr:hypothetical protein [Acidimicrobiia bacterium]